MSLEEAKAKTPEVKITKQAPAKPANKYPAKAPQSPAPIIKAAPEKMTVQRKTSDDFLDLLVPKYNN